MKNAFQKALEIAEIKDFTWHDLRHTFASWLIMKGASLRSVAELLGHRGLRMVMRYAHLSLAYLSAEVGLLDPPCSHLRARKGQQKGNVPQRACGDRRWWWNFRKEVARRTGRFPQLVDPRSGVNGLLLTGSPRFRDVRLDATQPLPTPAVGR